MTDSDRRGVADLPPEVVEASQVSPEPLTRRKSMLAKIADLDAQHAVAVAGAGSVRSRGTTPAAS